MPDFGPPAKRDKEHGTWVAACAAGEDIGLATSATVILVETGVSKSETGDKRFDASNVCLEKYLVALISVLDDVKKNSRQGKSVVNLSWTVEVDLVPQHYVKTLGKSILFRIASLLFKTPSQCGTVLFLIKKKPPKQKENCQWLAHSDGRGGQDDKSVF